MEYRKDRGARLARAALAERAENGRSRSRKSGGKGRNRSEQVQGLAEIRVTRARSHRSAGTRACGKLPLDQDSGVELSESKGGARPLGAPRRFRRVQRSNGRCLTQR